MLRRFIGFILIFTIMCSSFSTVLVNTGFLLNKKYIAENLCENRDRPWKQCQGKCVLEKKLKEAKEKEAVEMYKALQLEAVLINSISPDLFYNLYQGQDFPLDDFRFSYSYLKEIFHPPTVFI